MSEDEKASPYCPRPARAFGKLLVILGAAAILLCALIYFIDEETLDTLKQSLSVGTIVALVIVVNLASFIVFMVMHLAWQWIRCDLKPPRPENRPETSYLRGDSGDSD